MKVQRNGRYLNEATILSLHDQVDCARKAQEAAIDSFIDGQLPEFKAIEAVNYLESLEHFFVQAGGCYKDLYH